MATEFCVLLDVDHVYVVCKAQGDRSKVKVTILKNVIFTFTRKKVTRKKFISAEPCTVGLPNFVCWWTQPISRLCVKVKGQGHHVEKRDFLNFIWCIGGGSNGQGQRSREVKVNGLGSKVKFGINVTEKAGGLTLTSSCFISLSLYLLLHQ